MSNPSPTLPFQFTIAATLAGVAAVAVVCAATNWLGTFPTRSLPPTAVFIAAIVLAGLGKDPDLAWALVAAAWSWALCDMGIQMLKCFRIPLTMPLASNWLGCGEIPMNSSFPCTGCPPPGYVLCECLMQNFCLAVAWPLSFSAPAVWLIHRITRRSHSVARKWLILCPLLGILNAVTLTAAISMVVLFVGW